MTEPTHKLPWSRPTPTEPLPVVKLRGLRFPVLPSANLMAQMIGGLAALVGLFWLAGPAVTLLVGGVTSVVLAALHEAGRI